MNKYNLDKLVKVAVRDFNQSMWYEYQTEKRFLGVRIRKAGFTEFALFRHSGEVFDEVPENHILKDGIVYQKPKVILHYVAEHYKEYYFESLSEAKQFSDKITSVGRWQS